MEREINVVEFNPEWGKMFKKEAAEIRKTLGKNCVAVHHIGSTSVPGLAAKPIIDIMPVVKDISAVDAHDAEFISLGYECRGEFGIPGRRFYTKGGDERTHHIHIFEKSNKTDIERHLAVRDYLREHDEDAKRYAELKKQLAEEFTYDNDGYCDGKAPFMKELEEKAIVWKKEQKRRDSRLAIGITLGMLFGISIGSVFESTGTGMCIGILLGVAVGATPTKRTKNRSNTSDGGRTK